MPSQRTRTALYSEDRRRDLADAVVAARQFAGWDTTTDLIKAVGRGSRAIYALENAEPTVGHAVLSAVGRTLGTRVTGWTADTPRLILEGQTPPPLIAPSGHAQPEVGEFPLGWTAEEEQEYQSVYPTLYPMLLTQGLRMKRADWRSMRDEAAKLVALEQFTQRARSNEDSNGSLDRTTGM